MNKSILILCFCLVCLFLSCARPDYDDEIGATYWEAYNKIKGEQPTGESTDEPTTEPTNEPTS